MTTNDIENIQIIAKTKDGEYLITTSDNYVLINFVASICAFHKVKKELFEKYSLSELTDGQG